MCCALCVKCKFYTGNTHPIFPPQLTTSAAPSQLSTQVLSTPSDGGNTLRRDDPRLAHPEASQPALGESRARTEGRHAPAEAHVSSTRNVRKVLTDSAADEGGRGRPAEGGWLAKVARTLSLRRQLSNGEGRNAEIRLPLCAVSISTAGSRSVNTSSHDPMPHL